MTSAGLERLAGLDRVRPRVLKVEFGNLGASFFDGFLIFIFCFKGYNLTIIKTMAEPCFEYFISDANLIIALSCHYNSVCALVVQIGLVKVVSWISLS